MRWEADLTDILETLETLRIAKLDERGRIYIPKAAREQLQIKLGDKIYIKIEKEHLVLYTTSALRKRLRQI